jgi:two-component system sensor histidine kinase DegS
VMLDLGDDLAHLVVEDNGSGFNVAEVLNAAQPKGIGLGTLRERLAMLGGDFRVESAVGRGTKVTVQMSIGA